MALGDLYSNVQFLLRWIHVIAGITWIGHLYFFNFVNAVFQTKIPADYKKVVNPELLLRALFWFRWGAMITFIAGLLLFTQLYMYANGTFGPTQIFTDPIGFMGLTSRAWWILIGMLAGTMMWANVWFVIWPAQQKIIKGIQTGVPADPALPKRAAHASKVNVYLSGPMLFGMLGANHYGAINLVTVVVVVLIGVGAAWWAYQTAPKVSTSL